MDCPPGYPVPSSQWRVKGDSCLTCGNKFSIFSAKSNCTCCGQMFCTTCLHPERCLLPPSASPTKVCTPCFNMVFNHRRQQDTPASTVPAKRDDSPRTRRPAANVDGDCSVQIERLIESAKELRDENEVMIQELAGKTKLIASLRNTLDLEAGAKTIMEEENIVLKQLIRQMESNTQTAVAPLPCDASVVRRMEELEEKCSAYREEAEVHLRNYRELEERLRSTTTELEATVAHQVMLESTQSAAARKVEEQISSLSTTNTDLEERLAAAASKAAADLQVQVERHNSDASRWQQELENSQELLSQVKARLCAERDTMEMHLKSELLAVQRDLQQQAAMHSGEVTALSQENDALQQRLRLSESQLSDLTETLTQLRAQQQRAVSESTAQNISLNPAQEQLDQQRNEYVAAEQQHRRVVNAHEVRIRDLTEQNTRKDELLATLTHDLNEARDFLANHKKLSATPPKQEADVTPEKAIAEDQLNASADTSLSLKSQHDALTAHTETIRAGATTVSQRDGMSNTRQPSITDFTNLSIPPVRVSELPNRDSFYQWGYDTIGAAGEVPSILQSAASAVAVEWSLFDSTEELSRWQTMVAIVEAIYHGISYCHVTHAADVLHGVCAALAAAPELFSAMTRVEKLAVMFAAIAHDVKLPGRNNTFLKNTFDPNLFSLRGERVLERMHAATAYSLLAVPEADFTFGMSPGAATHLFKLVSHMVSHTDMAGHNHYQEMCRRRVFEGVDFSVGGDRLEVLTCVLHSADIGVLTKGLPVSTKWMDMLEEVRQQGDDEAACDLPVNPMNQWMDTWWMGQLQFLQCVVVPQFYLLEDIIPALTAPLNNLRTLFCQYSRLLGGGSFPRKVPYAPPARGGNTVEAPSASPSEAAAQEETAEIVEQREALLMQREEKLRADDAIATDAAQQRQMELEGHSSRLADRASDLDRRESQLNHLQEQIHQELKDVQLAASTPQKHTDSTVEQKVLHTLAFIVKKEKDMRTTMEELSASKRELEKREQLTSDLADQLAAVALRMKRQREQLRLRETHLRQRSAPPLHMKPSTKSLAPRRATASVPSSIFSQLERTVKLLNSAMHHAPDHRQL